MLRRRRVLALLTLAAFLLWGPAASVVSAALSRQPACAADSRTDEDAPKDSSEERGADEDGGLDLLLTAGPGLNESGALHFGDFLLRLPLPFVAAPDDPPNRA